MSDDPATLRDPKRIAALAQLQLIGQPVEPILDRLMRLAARLLRAPTALISLVTDDRQCFVAHVGLSEPWATTRETPLSHSFCQHVVIDAAPLIVDDARVHPLLHTNQAIIDMGVVAYLGVPITTADGLVLGSCCVIDQVPRVWSDADLAALQDLAALVVVELDRCAELIARTAAEAALRIRESQLDMINHQLPVVFWTTDTELRITGVFGSGIADMPSDPRRFLGQPIGDYMATTGASSAMIRASQDAYQRALAGQTGLYQRELGGYTAAVQIAPLRDAAGQIIGCLGGNIALTAPTRLIHELQDSRDRLQMLSTQLLHAQEAERRAIARELHDEIGQELTIIQMNMQDLLGIDPARLPDHIEDGIATVERVLAQVRTMALDLRPSQLDDLGLAEALRWYLARHAARSHLEIVFDLPDLTPPPPADVATTCFRIAQEAMTNILRSAHATHVWLTISVDAEGLTLIVRDDGRGFDVASGHTRAMHGSSLGLLSMEERAALIGGRTTIESTPGHGTTVQAWLPLRAPGATGVP